MSTRRAFIFVLITERSFTIKHKCDGLDKLCAFLKYPLFHILLITSTDLAMHEVQMHAVAIGHRPVNISRAAICVKCGGRSRAYFKSKLSADWTLNVCIENKTVSF